MLVVKLTIIVNDEHTSGFAIDPRRKHEKLKRTGQIDHALGVRGSVDADNAKLLVEDPEERPTRRMILRIARMINVAKPSLGVSTSRAKRIHKAVALIPVKQGEVRLTWHTRRGDGPESKQTSFIVVESKPTIVKSANAPDLKRQLSVGSENPRAFGPVESHSTSSLDDATKLGKLVLRTNHIPALPNESISEEASLFTVNSITDRYSHGEAADPIRELSNLHREILSAESHLLDLSTVETPRGKDSHIVTSVEHRLDSHRSGWSVYACERGGQKRNGFRVIPPLSKAEPRDGQSKHNSPDETLNAITKYGNYPQIGQIVFDILKVHQ
jgi:hypothetical protein